MVNIIIPTLDAKNRIRSLISALKKQSVTGEIIIIDSSSSDDTAKIAESCGAKVIRVKQEDFDHGGTRTLAGKAAGGDILIYLTQDVLPAGDDSIENLLQPFYKNGNLGASYGRQLPYPDARPFGAHLRLFNYPDKSYLRSLEDGGKYGIKAAFLSNSFAAYKRKALEDIGWFKENLISTEDTYAGAKLLLAGYKLAYVSDARVYHSHNYTVLQEFKRYFDIGVFHKRERWILDTFGKAEGEGIRYLRSEMAFLLKNRKYHLLPEFFIRNGLKYIGYILGKNHEKLPGDLAGKISMHRRWWSKVP